MAHDWEEGSLTWPDVPNLKPLDEDDAINATRYNFIRHALLVEIHLVGD